MVDDTCNFLPFSKETDARKAARALESEMAHDFFRSRVFWDAKRPISKAILQSLDLDRLSEALGGAKKTAAKRKGQQEMWVDAR